MAKAKAKSSGKNLPAIKLPAGFKAIERLGNFWVGREPGDSFEGKLLSVKLKHFDKTKDYAARDVNVYTFSTKSGNVEITQSGGLGALQQVKKGQQVFIAFLGMKKLKGKSPMREYLVAAK